MPQILTDQLFKPAIATKTNRQKKTAQKPASIPITFHIPIVIAL